MPLRFDMTPESLPVAVQTIQECGGGVLFLRFAYIKFDLFSKGPEFLPGLGGVRSFRLTVKALFLACAATELAAELGVGGLMFDRTLWEVFCSYVEDRGLGPQFSSTERSSGLVDRSYVEIDRMSFKKVS